MLEAKLFFDATSSRQFDWELLTFFKKHAGTYEGVPIIKETQRLASYKDDLVQLVDMVCEPSSPRSTLLSSHPTQGRWKNSLPAGKGTKKPRKP